MLSDTTKSLPDIGQAIDEARAEVGGVTWDSDDDISPPNGFDDILNEG